MIIIVDTSVLQQPVFGRTFRISECEGCHVTSLCQVEHRFINANLGSPGKSLSAWNGPVEIVGCSIKHTVDLSSSLRNYQRVESPSNPMKPPFSYGFPMILAFCPHKTTIFLWFSYGFEVLSPCRINLRVVE